MLNCCRGKYRNKNSVLKFVLPPFFCSFRVLNSNKQDNKQQKGHKHKMLLNSARDKKRVVQKLKQYRLVVQPAALDHFLTKVYTTTEDGAATGQYISLEDTLDKLVKHQLSNNPKETTLTVPHIDSFFSALNSSNNNGGSLAASTEKQTRLASSSSDDLNRQFSEPFDIRSVECQGPKFAQGSDLVQLQLQRTKIIYQLCQSSNLLSSLQMIPINALISSRGIHSLFGTITQKIHDQSLYLEDTTGVIRLNLDKCDKIGEGIFCAGMSVIVNGEFNQVTQAVDVTAMILPPILPRDVPFDVRELPSESSRVVLIKDLFFDQVGVLERLYTLFDFLTNRDAKRDTLVMMLGSFVSPEFKASNQSNMSAYRGFFVELVPLLNHFSNLKFRFVSGSRDLCPGGFNGMLPRSELSHQIRDLFSQMKHVKFCTDPCTGSWWDKIDVRVCADFELGSRFLRNNLFRFADHTNIQRDDEWVRAWRTVIRQRHLVPFELTVQPVYWKLDSQLSLVSFLDEGSRNERQKVIIVGDSRRDWRGRYEEVDGVMVICAPSWYHNNQYMIWDSNGIETQTLLTE